MSTSKHKSDDPLPDPIQRPLLALRRLIHRYVLELGCLAAVLYALVAFWLFGLLDYLPIRLGSNESPVAARAIMLTIWGVGTLYLVVTRGLAKWMVNWPLESLALLVERRFPGLESRMSTVVQGRKATPFENEPDLEALHQSMLSRTEQQAIEKMSHIDVSQVINWKPLLIQRALSGTAFAASLLMIAVQPAWTLHWGKRFFALSNDAWPRSVELRVDGIELEVPPFSGQLERTRYLRAFQNGATSIVRGRGGNLRVSANTSAKRVPTFCTVLYRTEDGVSGRANLRRLVDPSQDWLPFLLEGPPMESIDQSLYFSVAAEDLKLPGYSIVPEDGPLIAKMSVQVEYPTYLQATTKGNYLPEILEYRNGMRLPQGSSIRLVGKCNGPLDKVEFLQVRAASLEAEESSVQLAAISGDTFEVPIGKLEQGVLIEFRVWNQSGLCAERVLQFAIGMINDDVPSVDLALEGIGQAITPVAMLPLRANLRDDHGARKSWTELVLNESPVVIIPTTGVAEGKFSTTLDLKELNDTGKLPVHVNTTLSLTFAADDHFDLNEAPHVGRAAPIQLAIVEPSALLILLDKREGAMRKRIELIISELTQMRELIGKIGNQETDSEDTSGDRAQRMQQLRAQQSTMQVHKSEGELRGIEREIGQIVLELINNRIDSKDRQVRLDEKVRQPILKIIDVPFPKLVRQLADLENQAMQKRIQSNSAHDSIETTDEVLVMLNEVLQNMIDMQDFNEIVDQVRGMLESQEQAKDQTKKLQKKEVLDRFK